MQELLRQCFVQFRCQLVEEKLIDEKAIFIDGPKIEANDPFQPRNWVYDEVNDTYTCPNQKSLSFKFISTRKDPSGFVCQFKVYECEDCTGCPLRH